MAATFNRRQFLQLGAAALGSLAMMKLSSLMDLSVAQATPATVLLSASDEKIVPGVCLLCSSGCGVLSRVSNGRVVKLEGNPMHPINLGALCPKGQAIPELVYNPDRLKGPMRRNGPRGSGKWEPATWDEAVQVVANRLSELRGAGHPEQAALMYGDTRGQLRSFFERFMNAVGSPNTISSESLNIAAARLGMYLTQGIYDLPVYDLENSAYILSFGASLLEAGRVPQRTIAGYAFMRRGRATRGKIVMIDPRQGITGAKADEWIPIIPGTDAALALGIAHVLISSGLIDSDAVFNYGFGYDDFADENGHIVHGFKTFVMKNYSPQQAEKICGVPATTISRLAGEFAGQKPAVAIIPGKGGLLNGSFGGVYAAMAVHILNALVGSIDKPGGVMTQRYTPAQPWPDLPGDPVAEQGRQSERIDGAGSIFPIGRHSYQSVADQVLAGKPLDALFLYDANPVFEAPGGKRFEQAFTKIPFIVSFSSFMDESAQFADWILPEPTFLERWEDDHIEGLGYPGIALRQPAITPRHDTLNTADFILKVAAAMGGPVASAFPWLSYEDVLQFRLKDSGTDWGMLKDLGVWMTPGYRFAARGSEKWTSEVVGSDRRKSPRDGRFDFFSRELYAALREGQPERISGLELTPEDGSAPLPHYLAPVYMGEEGEYPFVLNIYTLMSLGTKSVAANMPTLQEISGMTVGATWDSWLEMNPEAAAEAKLNDHDLVWVESSTGRVKTKVRLVKGVRPDVVNLPYNQGHTAVGRWANGRGVNGVELLSPASEPLSGLASFTNTRVKVYRA